MSSKLLLTLQALILAGQLTAQPSAPVYQTMTCVKAQPGKYREYRDFVTSVSPKLAQVSIDAGLYNTWTLLESVRPAGEEARCDFVISTLSDGAPTEPQNNSQTLDQSLTKAGVKMTAAQFLAKRDAASRLVSQEIWGIRIRVGAPQKGNYLYLNYMKVKDAPAYYLFENEVWRLLAEGWIKEGSQSAWIVASRIVPSGTDLPYAAYSADVYPNWSAVFKPHPAQAMFEKVHAGKNYQETMGKLGSLRDLARRELYSVVDRVTKK